MKQIIPFAHDLLAQSITTGSTVVDATLGNGHDSLYLNELVGPEGKVIAFDVQDEALQSSKSLFEQHGIKQVEMHLKGHENAPSILDDKGIHEIDAVIFNLGFLPGSDHQVTTSGDTTIQAINGLFPILKSGGYIVIVVYPGHEEGQAEKNDLMNYLKTFPANKGDIAQYKMVNRSDKAPFVVYLYKK
ncbi:class I SAM-dependent methyltransferase [Aquisalibacillus elongatus]|uniref:Putative rRNA methylase n=1 Tax=Aquisalibacillus elongatus TaxID=485577 RepID=A0A3N5BRX9_9BACI|nr:class I SAM-dependent methyltransferase [Aquisalibacillus elongatus]RPF50252.1 putative rRNA methylase [Aquisalibacillus elongatus]